MIESDLIRLRGKQPKLTRKQEAHLVSLVHSGEYSTLEVAELFGVGRSTVYPGHRTATPRSASWLGRGCIEALRTPRRRPSRIRHPSGTPAPNARFASS
jgi:hypothetical protein